METIVNVIAWPIVNYEITLWILGGLFAISVIQSAVKETEIRSWSDEKLEARSGYLYARDKSDMMIWREQYRREKIASKQRTKEEWSKYE